IGIAMFFVGAFFLIWDHLFTVAGVWSFNPDYILGYYLFSLPLEEWLFFLTVPFACVFIHEVLKYFFPIIPNQKFVKPLTFGLIFLFLLIALTNTDRQYTFVNFLVAAITLGAHWVIFGSQYLGRFYLSYLVHLIPFLLVNGVLTSLPVVEYNDMENLGIRLITIPIEDTVYSMTLLFMNLSIYEYLLSKSKQLSHPKIA
ncbi:MAG: lycopene cyclase domain-containing protein, partial [Flammeovirgaceae bacterium]